MFKTIGLFKRRPGTTVEEFREYYETKHRLIVEKYLKGHASRYARRFLDPVPGTDGGDETDYDVLNSIRQRCGTCPPLVCSGEATRF